MNCRGGEGADLRGATASASDRVIVRNHGVDFVLDLVLYRQALACSDDGEEPPSPAGVGTRRSPAAPGSGAASNPAGVAVAR